VSVIKILDALGNDITDRPLLVEPFDLGVELTEERREQLQRIEDKLDRLLALAEEPK
jgi:hypothetical protein